MLHTILVPLDGSALAERALPFGAGLARAGPGGSLVLVRAHLPFQSAPLLDMATIEAVLRQERLAAQEAEAYLEHLAARLRKQGLAVTAFMHRGGAAEVILAAAEAHGAGAIAMSTHGRGGLGRWVYGSVADQVLRGATRPVFLVPAAAEAAWPADRPPRVLVALDGSERAEAVLPPVLELARRQAASLLLVRAVDARLYAYADGYVYEATEAEAERREAVAYLQHVADRVRREAQLPVETHVGVGPVAREILETARAWRVDLVAIATHGRGGLSRLVLGSVATGVVQRAHQPLLLVRPAGPAEALPAGTARPEAHLVRVELAPHELATVRRGLEGLLAGDHPVEPARTLLERLDLAAARQAAPTPGDG